ncbi:coiled-coil domain-containing protein 66 isoform X2 [Alosa sapidissima]|uniref:coiled-coil domain-containing protein 66 isoform X2 n=1 Tax=Alosa sapidissima TaxID=34773 RepID=UPI001C0A33F8|nr:coiled-coil domain-containing protein 66 isoform X2 [Alosa sapidissima]
MNLGDGLLFELENGKPRLIFTSHGFESKTSNKSSKNPSRNRPPKLITASKQVPQEASRERPQRTEGISPGSYKNTSDTTTANVDNHAVLNGTGKIKDKRVARVQSVKRSDTHKTKTANEIQKNNPKESLVCLTQDQLQQILSNINKTACPGEQDDTHSKTQMDNPREDGLAMSRETHEALISDGNLRQNGSAQEKGKDNKIVLNGTVAGFLGKLGERELDKEALEARRAQWRRELDDQLLEKRQETASAEATLPGGTRQIKSSSRDAPVRLQKEKLRLASGMGDTDSQGSTFSSQRDLPAAIRSAFVLGEAAPSDAAFSTAKKEQQRLWLQELDQQRQEVQQRRRQEKLLHNQAEDHDRWAMHFDSLHKSLLPQPSFLPYDKGEAELCSSPSRHHSPSRTLSSGWEAVSVSGRDSQGRSSVDTTSGNNPPKASYLRTMTALLDPAQLEERERKRLKQLEHQRAINTQVEERRRQREKEELERKQQEQEEERRVAKERECLQQQYLLDSQRERVKEELLCRRTEEMLLSVQRAQEEAQKDKQLQRIRELARKGHDVSKLLGSLERGSADSVQTHITESQSPSDSLSNALRIEELSPASPRRETGVQTDMAGVISDARAHCGYPAPIMDMAVEHCPAPPSQPRRSQKETQLQEQSSWKENMWNATAEPQEVRESNLYEQFQRTSHRTRPVNGKRPEWNTRQPSRPFVPASERYPPGLRLHRQESRLRRQMELLTLVERNAYSRTSAPLPQELATSTSLYMKEDISDQPKSHSMVVHAERVCCSPIPTFELHQQQQLQAHSSAKKSSEGSCDAPPSPDYVPYVRTDEVYQLDPLAMPQTQEPQRKQQTVVASSRQSTPVAVRDPLLHPELLKNRERQQAILKGLSELRQGLLQKQRELETGLNPLLQGQGPNMAAHF